MLVSCLLALDIRLLNFLLNCLYSRLPILCHVLGCYTVVCPLAMLANLKHG
ncbi:hypothetical protein Sjap_012649 [Stephania japonica]|uniref:Uncharacterized protein n=1 Tax=Stephania japonica TaxID=461633 RepID=A0AAP0IYD5_9MAGN